MWTTVNILTCSCPSLSYLWVIVWKQTWLAENSVLPRVQFPKGNRTVSVITSDPQRAVQSHALIFLRNKIRDLAHKHFGWGKNWFSIPGLVFNLLRTHLFSIQVKWLAASWPTLSLFLLVMQMHDEVGPSSALCYTHCFISQISPCFWGGRTSLS